MSLNSSKGIQIIAVAYSDANGHFDLRGAGRYCMSGNDTQASIFYVDTRFDYVRTFELRLSAEPDDAGLGRTWNVAKVELHVPMNDSWGFRGDVVESRPTLLENPLGCDHATFQYSPAVPICSRLRGSSIYTFRISGTISYDGEPQANKDVYLVEREYGLGSHDFIFRNFTNKKGEFSFEGTGGSSEFFDSNDEFAVLHHYSDKNVYVIRLETKDDGKIDGRTVKRAHVTVAMNKYAYPRRCDCQGDCVSEVWYRHISLSCHETKMELEPTFPYCDECVAA